MRGLWGEGDVPWLSTARDPPSDPPWCPAFRGGGGDGDRERGPHNAAFALRRRLPHRRPRRPRRPPRRRTGPHSPLTTRALCKPSEALFGREYPSPPPPEGGSVSVSSREPANSFFSKAPVLLSPHGHPIAKEGEGGGSAGSFPQSAGFWAAGGSAPTPGIVTKCRGPSGGGALDSESLGIPRGILRSVGLVPPPPFLGQPPAGTPPHPLESRHSFSRTVGFSPQGWPSCLCLLGTAFSGHPGG